MQSWLDFCLDKCFKLPRLYRFCASFPLVLPRISSRPKCRQTEPYFSTSSFFSFSLLLSFSLSLVRSPTSKALGFGKQTSYEEKAAQGRRTYSFLTFLRLLAGSLHLLSPIWGVYAVIGTHFHEFEKSHFQAKNGCTRGTVNRSTSGSTVPRLLFLNKQRKQP